jgi:hypothetical protein
MTTAFYEMLDSMARDLKVIENDADVLGILAVVARKDSMISNEELGELETGIDRIILRAERVRATIKLEVT